MTITGDYDVDDQKVKDYFKQMFDNYGPFYTADPDKTTVEEGDIVNVDYVGKLDGTAFSGGTAQNQNIDVYQNASATGTGYIDGFTDGLKGASVGDVIDCDVTFPDDYGNTDLAGKAVVFTFTVNSIQKEMTIDDVDDAFAKEQFQVDTVDEMYDQIRSYMESSAEYSKQKDTTTAVQNYLIDNCEAEVPEEQRYLFISPSLYNLILNVDTTKSKAVLESFQKVVKVPKSRFYTSIVLNDGSTEGQTDGGFAKGESAKEINFMIIHKPALLQYPKHTVNKIIAPQDNQTSDGWKFFYRAYGLADLYENKAAGVYLHSKA